MSTNTRERCLRQLALVRESADDVQAAYVLRTRLKRLILNCTEVIAVECGEERPILPRRLGIATSNERTEQLKRICHTLLETTETLCQPSEPLDARWQSGWALVRDSLDRLEKVL